MFLGEWSEGSLEIGHEIYEWFPKILLKIKSRGKEGMNVPHHIKGVHEKGMPTYYVLCSIVD
jgi:hypothetical protein